ncbi:protein QUIRKY [Prunus yedoensis var. nudiflora]|uniref:Protein QUIRKY n=1 Tax=Prunus yedoensis var. nudiflora TaxID=2094558 RepID=A0A314YL61_PRUYE|nr:protein QUIRKY [Prunus yedoensis var. nudiflora]
MTPPRTVRKLIIEVVDARDLLPKDGQGSSSPYVVADFDGQRKRTSTKYKSLNPAWNEALEFVVSDPDHMEYEELEIEVLNDKRFGNSSGTARKNHFLGRVKLYGTQFSRRGDEGLVYFQLEKKSVFSWIKGEIGLRIYYYDELVEESPPPPPQEDPPPEKPEKPRSPRQGFVVVEEGRVFEVPGFPLANRSHESSYSPPVVVVEESPPPVVHVHSEQAVHDMSSHHQHQPEAQFQPEVRKMETHRGMGTERVRILRKPNGDFSPKVISKKFAGPETERIHPRDLNRQGSRPGSEREPLREGPYIDPHGEVEGGASQARRATDSPEWNQVFALAHNRPDSVSSDLEIVVLDSPSDKFLGGIRFNLADVLVRDPPDSPLAPQWCLLDGDQNSGRITGEIQLSVWIGTQADDAFPEAWSSDAPFVAHTRSKVYQSPKLWYLRLTIMEAQDLHIPSNLPPLTAPEIRVKAQLGPQSARTRRGCMNNHSASFHWNEDLIFVAGEPLEDSLILLVEDRTNKDAALLGHVIIPVSSIEQRIDERYVASKWFGLECQGSELDATKNGCCGLGILLSAPPHVPRAHAAG